MGGARTDVSLAGEGLVNALRCLSSAEGVRSQSERNWAAKTLLAELQRWAPSTVWKAFGRWLRQLAPADVDGLIADAVQSLALVASTSVGKFRGQSEASARAWCRRVLLNHVSNELRLRKAISNVALSANWVGQEASSDPPALLEEESEPLPHELMGTLTMLRALRKQIFAVYRPRDAESRMRAVWCYLAYASGAPLEEQVRALNAASDDEADQSRATPVVLSGKRQRNRVYKLRERGRKTLCQAITAVSRRSDASVLGVPEAMHEGSGQHFASGRAQR